MDNKPRSKLLESFQQLEELGKTEEIRVEELFERLSSSGNAFPSLVFAIPFFFPVPVPGLSTFLGMIIMAGGIGLALQKKPWFPKRWANKKIRTNLITKIAHFGAKVSYWVERITVPTSKIIISYPVWINQAAGILIVLCGFFLALPLPPGTNFPPAFSIFFLALGVLEANIVLMFIGLLAFALNIALFYTVFLGLAKAMSFI